VTRTMVVSTPGRDSVSFQLLRTRHGRWNSAIRKLRTRSQWPTFSCVCCLVCSAQPGPMGPRARPRGHPTDHWVFALSATGKGIRVRDYLQLSTHFEPRFIKKPVRDCLDPTTYFTATPSQNTRRFCRRFLNPAAWALQFSPEPVNSGFHFTNVFFKSVGQTDSPANRLPPCTRPTQFGRFHPEHPSLQQLRQQPPIYANRIAFDLLNSPLDSTVPNLAICFPFRSSRSSRKLSVIVWT